MVFVFFKALMGAGETEYMESLRTMAEGFGFREQGHVLAILCVALLLLTLLRVAVQQGNLLFEFLLRRRLQEKVAVELFSGYLHEPYLNHLSGSVASRYNNISVNAGGVVQKCLIGTVTMAGQTLLMLMFLTVMVYVRPIETAVAILAIGLVALLYWQLLKHRFTRWGRVVLDMQNSMYRVVAESLRGIKVVKVMGLESFFCRDFSTRQDLYLGAQMRQTFAAQAPRAILEVTLLTGILTFMAIAFVIGSTPAEIVPTMALFGAATLRMLPASSRILTGLQDLRYAGAQLDAIYDDLQRLRALKFASHRERANAVSFKDSISLSCVSFQYEDEGTQAVADITLEIRQGEFVAFTGLSGSGKSTIVNIIMGLLPAVSGEIRFDGITQYFSEGPPLGLFGYVPQDPFVVDDTLRRNIALGIQDKEISESHMDSVIRASALDGVVARLPRGKDTALGEHGIRLSGGERQRLGLARALYGDAEILVLDEPTSALDATTEAQVATAIHALKGKKTVIMIAHRLSVVRDCDQIFFLSNGKLADSGTFDEVSARTSEFSEMVKHLQIRSAPIDDDNLSLITAVDSTQSQG